MPGTLLSSRHLSLHVGCAGASTPRSSQRVQAEPPGWSCRGRAGRDFLIASDSAMAFSATLQREVTRRSFHGVAFDYVTHAQTPSSPPALQYELARILRIHIRANILLPLCLPDTHTHTLTHTSRCIKRLPSTPFARSRNPRYICMVA